MATIASLPAELLLAIFEYTPEIYHQHLSRYALVCRAWRTPAQQCLFGVIELHASNASAFLRSPGRAKYATRDLGFGDTVDVETGKAVLDACRGVRALDVGWEPVSGGYTWCSSPGAEDVKDLVLAYPESFPADAALLPLHLRSLKIFTDGVLSDNTIQSIFSSSTDTLTTLQVVLGWGDNSKGSVTRLATFFNNVAFPNLHTLLIDTTGTQEFAPTLISSLPNIKALSVQCRGWSDIYIVAENVNVQLTNLAITFTESLDEKYQERTLQELEAILKRPNLAGLTRLSLPEVQQPLLDSPGWTALLEECETRSIALLCAEGYM
ncbi:hypothetical protein RQP46_010708 [Phenoliferia psychrophenolica]